MGIFFSSLWRRLTGTGQQYKIVLVGLNNAGKTTILYKLHLGEAVVTQPTIGCNIEELRYGENSLPLDIIVACSPISVVLLPFVDLE